MEPIFWSLCLQDSGRLPGSREKWQQWSIDLPKKTVVRFKPRGRSG
jgi:hypothetical protein